MYRSEQQRVQCMIHKPPSNPLVVQTSQAHVSPRQGIAVHADARSLRPNSRVHTDIQHCLQPGQGSHLPCQSTCMGCSPSCRTGSPSRPCPSCLGTYPFPCRTLLLSAVQLQVASRRRRTYPCLPCPSCTVSPTRQRSMGSSSAVSSGFKV